ncbi:MAG: HDOD domain-containing protein [Anaeromyxobacter sp.]
MTAGGTSAAEFGSGTDLDTAMADLVSRDAVELPPYPAVALRIARLVRGGDYGLDELARLVGTDQALAAELLRVANSSLYQRGTPVASLPAAASRIGAEELSRLGLALGLGPFAGAKGPLAPLRRRAWHDALASAVMCRDLARVRKVSADDAFTCGLLHDFGKIVAIAAIERIAAGSQPARAMPASFWGAVVDRYHVDIGNVLASRWQLPDVVGEVIAHHHAAADSDAAKAVREPEILELVRTVDPLVGLLSERSSLGPAEVAALTKLSEADTDALERTLQALPSFVASLEQPALPEGHDWLEGPAHAPSQPAGERRVYLHVGGGDFEATGFGPHQLHARGTVPLPEGILVEVEALSPRPFTFHARVLLCWAEGPRFGVVLMPFALSGPALLHWRALVPSGGDA